MISHPLPARSWMSASGRSTTTTSQHSRSPLAGCPGIGTRAFSASQIISAAILADPYGRRRSAQRLSASQFISVESTPPSSIDARSRAQRLFGITVYCRSSAHARRNAPQHVLNAFRHHGIYRLRRANDHVRLHEVLNAFRHHGIYRPTMASTTTTAPLSAQRLSASRNISACPTCHSTTGSPCAQRLSASRNISAQLGGGGGAGGGVLNAFRHHGIYRRRSGCWSSRFSVGAQRLSASRNISADTVRSDKRNYLSAQRLSASRNISDGRPTAARSPSIQCSTPFGITEYIGRAADGGPVAFDPVLNAFRHHGIYRRRLASQMVCHMEIVLNAFRHHGIYRSMRARRRSSLSGAQRLSASRNISVQMVNCFLQKAITVTKHGSLGLL